MGVDNDFKARRAHSRLVTNNMLTKHRLCHRRCCRHPLGLWPSPNLRHQRPVTTKPSTGTSSEPLNDVKCSESTCSAFMMQKICRVQCNLSHTLLLWTYIVVVDTPLLALSQSVPAMSPDWSVTYNGRVYFKWPQIRGCICVGCFRKYAARPLVQYYAIDFFTSLSVC